MQLTGKVALVTGGSRGIGRAIAEKFAACGADVAVLYAGNTVAAEDTVAHIEAAGAKGKAYCCNVADSAAVTKTVELVIEDFGRVDILVNNAGVVRDGLILQMSDEDFDVVLQTNLKGAFHLTRQLYRPFMRQRSGRIINIGSVVGLVGNAGQANYAAAKAGLIAFTQSTAKELASRGVTCNVIAPGFIESDMTDALPEKVREKSLAGIPAGRYGAAGEVAELAAFLAGDAASYITGEVIRVDGGMCI